MEYWWVNHKQTFHQEVSGGYIWSPQRRTDGASSHFYDNMTKVHPGDFVFSYAGGEVRAIGVATARASAVPKPSEYGRAGASWSNDGWFIPVEFKRVDKPLKPKQHMGAIAPLLPEKYSPLQANGNGNQAAYLSSISEDLAAQLFGLLGASSLLPQLKGVGVSSWMEEENDRAEAMLRERTDITQTEKEQVVMARRGQGVFRANVEALEQGCRITGLQLKEHLRASHIKPWRDSTNVERLDGNNGLLLAPHVDHLFDKGYLSFDEQGDVLVSSRLNQTVLEAWNIDRHANVGTFTAEQSGYMAYHRTHVFQR